MNKPTQITNAVLAAREFARCARLLRTYAEDVDAPLYLDEVSDSLKEGTKLVGRLRSALRGSKRKKKPARWRARSSGNK